MSESCYVGQKPMSCGRHDRQIQLGSYKFYRVCSEPLSQNTYCFDLADISALSHLKPQKLVDVPQGCRVPTPSP